MAQDDLRAVAFPTLNEAQIEKLGTCAEASLKKCPDEQELFKVGERNFRFFVVKSGEVEIIDESATHRRPSSFIGPESSPARWRSLPAALLWSAPSHVEIPKCTKCQPSLCDSF
jgi:hypothetical protein